MADHSYDVDKRLMIVPVKVFSPTHFIDAKFVLDTGASHTIVDYRLAAALGYAKETATSASTVRSAVGCEEGYRTRIDAIEALGKKLALFEIACHPLFEQGVEGLLGMTFLEQFEFCIFPKQRIIRI